MEDIPRHSPNQNWRVKVYLLNPTGNWDDCGAGTLDIVKEVKLEEEIEFLKVSAHDEFSKNNTPTAPTDKLEKLKGGLESERNILYLPILMDNQYDHQGDTIISWIDRNIDEEIALSFLEPSIAKETWRVICARIGRNPSDDRKYKDYDQLMMPNMENLDQIKYDFETKKDWMVGAILENKGFMDKLFQVFRDLEDLESLENLHTIYAIIRLMIFSEDVNLLELLLSDEYYLLVFGALEYDSEVPEATRPKYREFLQNQSFYKKVIDFQDETVLKKIRLNYRISYLKDTVITSIIDDPISSQFNPISYVTNRDILEHIMSNDHYFDELFEKMISNPKDAVGFLYDLTQIVKLIVQMEDKLSFGRKLVRKNVFTAIAKSFEVLDSPNQTEQIDDEKKNILKINLVDTLVFIMQLELNAFIDFLKSSSDSKLMITGIINNLFYGDQGLQIQTGELIKFLIDITHERKDEILEIFYENFMPAFVEHYKKLENNEKFYSFVQQLVEVLIHCIKSHEYRIRHYILHHKLLHKMNPGFKSRDKSLHLALIRLIKHIVLSKDEFLIKYISHNNLLDDLFEVYFKNAFRNNLVNSACLELVQLIQHENIRMLIVDITEKFRDKVREYSLERFFKSLFDKYDYIAEEFHREMSQESVDHTPGAKLQISAVIGENFENYNSREISYMEDEEYFEADDDEDENARSKGLSVSDKSNLDFTQKILDQVLQQPIITEVSEQQIKSSKDCLQKMKEKLASRKLEAEEDNKFSFGNNRGRNRSSSTERPNFINIQLSMPSNENVQSVGFEPAMGKRAGIDLGSDDETREDGKVDPQKKIKI